MKKSRVKSKQKTQETQTRVKSLKTSNKLLEEKIENHTKTLKFLKELFLAQAQAKPDKMSPAEWEELLKEDEDEEAADAPATKSTRSSDDAGPSTSSSSGSSSSKSKKG